MYGQYETCMRICIMPTEQQHLNLVSLRHLVAFELCFDLIVAYLARRIFFTCTATHFDRIYCDSSYVG